MNETFAQHDGQSPPISPSGEWQAAQSGGRAVSRTRRKAGRPNCATHDSTAGRRTAAAGMSIGSASAIRSSYRRFDGWASPDHITGAKDWACLAMTPLIFDRLLVRTRRRRALRLGPETFLIDRVAEEFADRLKAVLRRFDIAADLGTPTEAVRAALARSGSIATMIAVDRLIEAAPGPADDEASAALCVVADEEALPFAAGALDLVVSGLTLQAVNDLPGVLVQIRRALKPDGLFLAALLGGETLTELRQSFAAAETECEGGVSPRVAPFPDLRDMGTLLQRAGFALPVLDADRLAVRYATPLALLHDLRRMGAANPLIERRRTPLRRATLMRAMDIYAARFADPDGKVRASFDIIWLSGWAPHESQQQPLRPGSAKTRLADALGTVEIGTGKKPER
jgi:SAM-dependent methyltransferase